MANNSPIHIHEIEPELSSSDIDGNELLVVSNPNGQSGYSTSKLTLNSLAEFVNGYGGSVLPSTDSIQGMITSTNDKIVIGVNNSNCFSIQPSLLGVSADICCNNCTVNIPIKITNSSPVSTKIDNCIIYTQSNIAYDGSDTSIINLYSSSDPASGIKLNANLFTYLKIITPTAQAERTEIGWNLTVHEYSA